MATKSGHGPGAGGNVTKRFPQPKKNGQTVKQPAPTKPKGG